MTVTITGRVFVGGPDVTAKTGLPAPVTIAPKLAKQVSRTTSSRKSAKRVFKCLGCGKAASAPGSRGRLPTRCVRCQRAALAQYLVRSAARIARQAGDDAFADKLARIVEL